MKAEKNSVMMVAVKWPFGKIDINLRIERFYNGLAVSLTAPLNTPEEECGSDLLNNLLDYLDTQKISYNNYARQERGLQILRMIKIWNIDNAFPLIKESIIWKKRMNRLRK